MWSGFTTLKKADPYHDAQGKFTSAGGSAEGAVKEITKDAFKYSVKLNKEGKAVSVLGHYPTKSGGVQHYLMHDAEEGKIGGPKIQGIMKEAEVSHKADMAAQAEAAKGPAIVTVAHGDKQYNVHFNGDGKAHKVQGIYKQGNGVATYTLHDDSKGVVGGKVVQGVMAEAKAQKEAGKASVLTAPTAPEAPVKPSIPKAPIPTPIKIAPQVQAQTPKYNPLGQPKAATIPSHGDEVIHVSHEGKPYSVKFNDEGSPVSIHSHSLNGKPAPAFETWRASQGSLHTGQKQIITAAEKIKEAANPKVKLADGVDVITGKTLTKKVSVAGVFEDQHGETGEVLLHQVAVPSQAQAVLKTGGLEEFSNQFHKVLPSAEKNAISSYQGSGYSSINHKLRANEGGSPEISALDAALRRAYIPKALDVVRGVSMSPDEIAGKGFNLVGHVFTDKGFMSTSTSKTVANKFKNGSGASTVLHLSLPAGTRAMLMPQFNWEKEVLLPRNSTFKITKVVPDGKTTHLHLTYLGTKE